MTKLMGILNLTPDSFSGDGQHGKTLAQQLAHVDALIEAGAAVIDVGAESTRPGATTLSAADEWERVAPLASALGARTSHAAFSIDTYHPENARRALDKGFRWVNDVSGGQNPLMLKAAVPYDATLVLMHSLSVPANPSLTLPADADPVPELLTWGNAVLTKTVEAGIARERIVLDIGIGFGKTAGQSLTLIRNIAAFNAWGAALLVGHSRKSFLTKLLANPAQDRDAATLTVSMFLAGQGIDYLRVHDVAAHRAMLQVLGALT